MIPKEKHIEDIIKLIPVKPIYFFKDIFVFYKGCSRQWAYEIGIDKDDNIKELIYINKRKGVTTMMDKWMKSKNAALQIAAMRLLSDPEERQMLNQQYIDHTSGGQTITIVPPNLSDET